jgi:hypothetical protein
VLPPFVVFRSHPSWLTAQPVRPPGRKKTRRIGSFTTSGTTWYVHVPAALRWRMRPPSSAVHSS